MRILVIDDDIELCELVAEYLEPDGYQVDAAHDGVEGVKRALAEDYSLAVVDYMLPGLNGFEGVRLRFLDSQRKTIVEFSKTVILRPSVGRRISRNESGSIAASWLFHEDLRRNAMTRHVCSNHCGRSFGQHPASG